MNEMAARVPAGAERDDGIVRQSRELLEADGTFSFALGHRLMYGLEARAARRRRAATAPEHSSTACWCARPRTSCASCAMAKRARRTCGLRAARAAQKRGLGSSPRSQFSIDTRRSNTAGGSIASRPAQAPRRTPIEHTQKRPTLTHRPTRRASGPRPTETTRRRPAKSEPCPKSTKKKPAADPARGAREARTTPPTTPPRRRRGPRFRPATPSRRAWRCSSRSAATSWTRPPATRPCATWRARRRGSSRCGRRTRSCSAPRPTRRTARRATAWTTIRPARSGTSAKPPTIRCRPTRQTKSRARAREAWPSASATSRLPRPRDRAGRSARSRARARTSRSTASPTTRPRTRPTSSRGTPGRGPSTSRTRRCRWRRGGRAC
mmetsp:Transcript_4311/g.13530  ORF Transcript_4311/g.13530 Transcript_4311/m.13530 type:complete len:380 (-) Transcript_4311:73-1212(-)